jgi:hypothetical protein
MGAQLLEMPMTSRKARTSGRTAAALGTVVLLLTVAAIVSPTKSLGAPRFFSPTSFWNVPVAPTATVDPNSSAVVGRLRSIIDSEQSAHTGPWINTTEYSVPVYQVPADQATVQVHLIGRYFDPALQAAWNAVPLPPGAQPAAGHDHHLVVWQPSSDRMWEFWKLENANGTWQAQWGGAMRHVSNSYGVYESSSWPGGSSLWGATACSLPLVGGLITLGDLASGRIEHALAISIPDVRSGVYAAPAARSDGTSSDPSSLPEGAHLRLNPSLDLTQLHLPRLTRMIATAAQRYGIYVRDGGGVLSFYAEAPTNGTGNPYSGPTGYFEGRYPSQLLAGFPWKRLRLLRMDLRYRG